MEDVASLGLTQQEALDAPSDRLSGMYCLMERQFLVRIMPSSRLSSWSGLSILLSPGLTLPAQESPEIGLKEKLKEEKCGALLVDLVWDVSRGLCGLASTRVTFSDQPVLRFWAAASSGSDLLNSEDVSSSEG